MGQYSINNITDNITKLLIFSFGFFLPISNALTNISYMLFCIIFFLKWENIKNLRKIILNPAVLSILLLLLVYILSSFYSIAPIEDQFKTFRKVSRIILFPLFMVIFSNQDFQKTAIHGFLFGIIGFLISMTVRDYFGLDLMLRDSIHISYLLLFAGFLSFYLFTINKNPLYIVLFLISGGLYSSICISRISVLLIIALVLITARHFISNNIDKKYAFLIVMLAGCALFSSSLLPERINLAYENFIQYRSEISANKIPEYSSIGVRLYWYEHFGKLFLHKPILGYGIGSIKPLAETNFKVDDSFIIDNPHNEYLNIAVQTGLIGLLLFISFIFSLWHMRYELNDLGNYLIKILLAILVIGCCFNSWLLDNCSVCFLTYFIAIALNNKLSSKASIELKSNTEMIQWA